jgi:ArsR family transcriptional regulator, lead/cadmium/zinc/bismuth-responsive transcriptional repressor
MKNESGIEVCGCSIIHTEKVERARSAQISVSRLLELGEFFKVFAEPSRLRILNALASEELCVCDLTATLDMTQSAVSHQLAVLKRARLVRYRKEGKTVFYALDDDHVREILAVASEHLSEEEASHGTV